MGSLHFPYKILFSTMKWLEENLFPLEIFYDDQCPYSDTIKTLSLCRKEEKGFLCFHRGSTMRIYHIYGLK